MFTCGTSFCPLSVSVAPIIRALTASPSTCSIACSSSLPPRTPKKRPDRSLRSGEILASGFGWVSSPHRANQRCLLLTQLRGRGCGDERGGSHRPHAHRHGDVSALRHPADQRCRDCVSQAEGEAGFNRVWWCCCCSLVLHVVCSVFLRAQRSRWRTLEGSTLCSWMRADPLST